MANEVGMWVKQWDEAGIHTLEEMRRWWPADQLLIVKALDGLSWMNNFDHSGISVDSFQGSIRGGWSWADINALPFVNARGLDPAQEGRWAGMLADHAGGVVIDLEPYQSFWQGTSDDMDHYFGALLLAANGSPYYISTDIAVNRHPNFPLARWLDQAAEVWPQTYWNDFYPNGPVGTRWEKTLEDARVALEGRTVSYTIPGNSTPEEFANALDTLLEWRVKANVWVWQSTSQENWDAILAYPQRLSDALAADEPPPNPCSDLISRLGYIQGDLANAFEAEVAQMPHQTKKAAAANITALVQKLRES